MSATQQVQVILLGRVEHVIRTMQADGITDLREAVRAVLSAEPPERLARYVVMIEGLKDLVTVPGDPVDVDAAIRSTFAMVLSL